MGGILKFLGVGSMLFIGFVQVAVRFFQTQPETNLSSTSADFVKNRQRFHILFFCFLLGFCVRIHFSKVFPAS